MNISDLLHCTCVFLNHLYSEAELSFKYLLSLEINGILKKKLKLNKLY